MQSLEFEVADAVATVTLNRPAARNALDAAMKSELAELVPRIVADSSIRAVILAGAGGAFCAGGDLRGMAEARPTMTHETWRQRLLDVQPWLRGLIELDRPVIAAVDGPAFGAGFGIALAADFVLASPRARFCLSFMRVGLIPDFGLFYTLPRVVGVQRAKELMLSGREIDSEEALRLGIAMEIQPVERLMSRARAMALSFAGASPLATRLIKQDVGQSLASDLPTMLALEAEHQAQCFGSQYNADAVQRFLDKKPPEFSWPKQDEG